MRELHAYLDGTPVGRFRADETGRLGFDYDQAYLRDDDPTPLSLSMRPTRGTWGSRAVAPFLAGLLPDSAARLRRLASEYRTTEQPFRLLEHVGRDAAGAVQLLPPEVDAPDAATRSGSVDRLSDDGFEDLLAGLVRDPGPWGAPGHHGRWSLAGAQSKVALFRFDDGGWGIPEDATPTTHILKPALADLPDHDVNEFVTMSVARLLGLDVADHELVVTPSGRQVFVSRRYDRAQRADCWRRLHQEDLCQAMSVDPSRKYQEHGGPSVRQIAAFLRDNVSSPSERSTVQHAFFSALVFNLAVQGTDAHAKNYSLLLLGSSVRLAPLYDLASHAAYPTAGDAAARSAMSIGGEWRFSAIGERQLLDAAKSLNLPADEAIAIVRRITGGVAAAYDSVATDSAVPFARTLADAIGAWSRSRGWSD